MPPKWTISDRRVVILTSRMAVSNNFITVTVIQNIGRPLFNFGNNGDEKTDR